MLVEATGWQGLFWIDAAIAAALIPVTLARVAESRDPNRSGSIDVAGTVLIAVVLVPLVLALSEGGSWGWVSLATLSCLVISVLGARHDDREEEILVTAANDAHHRVQDGASHRASWG